MKIHSDTIIQSICFLLILWLFFYCVLLRLILNRSYNIIRYIIKFVHLLIKNVLNLIIKLPP